jgi:4-amino-4-deoxy-L-arabinose transferase-like glycosyltransferase
MSVRHGVGLLLLVAFLLRLGSNLALTVPTPEITADAQWYHSTATSLAAGLGYIHHFTRLPTAAWPPGYPAILASIYRIFGPDPAFGFLLNAIAGTVTCWLAGRIALAVISPRAQLVATALAAFTPSHVLFSSLLLSETIFTTMMTALVLAAVLLVRRSSSTAPWLRWFAWGTAAGLASLVRAEAVILLVAPVAALIWMRVPLARVAAIALIALCGIVAAETPWLLRNAGIFGRVVPVSVSFGRTFLIGHNPVADGGMNDYSPDPAADMQDLAGGGPAGELAVDNRLRDAGVRFMIEHPGTELRLVFRRFYSMFRADRVWGEWYVPGDPARVNANVIDWLGRISTLYYWLLLVLAAPPFVRSLTGRDGGRLVLVFSMLAWTGFFVIVLYGSQRFHFPLLPLCCVLAADTLSRRSRQAGPRLA